MLANCWRSQILTERGDVAVEDLRIGEQVVADSGKKRPIRGIGHRAIDVSRHPEPRDVWPMRIAANAFGAGLHVRPESSDLRALGLCVTRLQIDGETVALDDDALADGWHEAEFVDGTVSHRWTAGAAKLPGGARFVIVDLGPTGLYWRERVDTVTALFG